MQRDIVALGLNPVNFGIVQESRSAADSYRNPRSAAAGLGLLAVIVILVGLPASAAVVPTQSGSLDGVQEHGVDVYKGVPFAAPPIGSLRWRPPAPPTVWAGIRSAGQFAPICMQQGSYPEDAPPEPMSEDCLYLNIWVPLHGPAKKLPVMVWIYGGGLQNGSASTPLYAGDKLALKGVIVVTANYRLGVLGFLAHPDLSSESPQHVSGNYGLLDQIAALTWVQRNIAAFGGDPSGVTVFGQSSGSISISELVVSPLARGLFQRAIGESGGLFEPVELADDFKLVGAEQAGREFVAQTNVRALPALRAMPASELIKFRFNPHAVVDGYVLPRTPYEAYREGKQNDVDLLIGSNAREGRLFLNDQAISVATFRRQLDHDFTGPIVLLVGPRSPANDQEARTSFVTFEGEMRFGWDMWAWARLQSAAGRRPIFLYRYTQTSPYRVGDKQFGWGPSHGMEMPYVFDHLDQQSLPWTPKDRLLASLLSSYWTNFAKSGDPNEQGLPNWPRFTPARPVAMRLGETIAPGPIPDEADLLRIDRVYRAARFANQHTRSILAVIATLALAMTVGLIRLIARRIRRLQSNWRLDIKNR